MNKTTITKAGIKYLEIFPKKEVAGLLLLMPIVLYVAVDLRWLVIIILSYILSMLAMAFIPAVTIDENDVAEFTPPTFLEKLAYAGLALFAIAAFMYLAGIATATLAGCALSLCMPYVAGAVAKMMV